MAQALSIAYDHVGLILDAQGNKSEAVSFFRQSVAIAERLGELDPNNAPWQRDLAVAYERLGDALLAQGERSEALKFHRKSLAINRHLAKTNPQ
jgi:tetratricopeptide (TPR) repeat protein